MFGKHLNLLSLTQSCIDHDGKNYWVWHPNFKGNHISSKVYSHFNCNSNLGDNWTGWNAIWHLRVSPRVKYCIWTLFHGKVRTCDYFCYIGLGSQTICVLCGLDFEIAKHLFYLCPKAQVIWTLISNGIGNSIHFHNGITSGNWITLS